LPHLIFQYRFSFKRSRSYNPDLNFITVKTRLGGWLLIKQRSTKSNLTG